MTLTDDEQKLFSRLLLNQRDAQVLMGFFDKQLYDADRALRMQSEPVQVRRLQGRAMFIQEFIDTVAALANKG